MQIQYNNWTDEFGFDASKVQINHRQRVEDDELLERWRLTDDHLTYILPILDDDIERAKRWRPTIAGEWQEAIDHYQGDCRELGRTDMLPEYLTRLEEQFATKGGYRDLGVPEFYRLRNAGRTAMAARIVDLIEAELLRKWREAEVGWSLDDQVETLRTLRESLEDRRIGFDKRTSALREYVKTLEEDLTEQRDDAANTSALTWPLKKSGILQRYAVSVSDYMAARTELEAVKFAVELVPAIIEQLVQLQSMVEQVRGRVAKALENLNIAIDSRLRNDEGSAAAALRRFDPAKVSQLRDRMVRDKSEMGRIASEIRRTLLDTPKLRNSPHFRSLLEDLDGVALDQRLLERCDAEIKAVHDAVIQGDTDRVLGVKLIQRLRTEFGGDRERLDAFARELVDKAKPYILIRDVEKKRDNKTIGAGSDARLESAMVVQRPKPAGFEDFLKALDGALQNTQVGITIPDPPTSKPNALTVMSVYAGFPIRFLDVVDYLKSEYENKLKNSVGLTRLEVHTEDAGAELPDLFAVVGPPPNAMPYLLLARTFEFVLDNKNTETGRKEVVLKCKDSGGFDTLVKIADSWDDLPKNLQHKDFLTIKKMVEAKIGNDLVHQDAKKAVNATIVALVNGIGEKAGLQSAIYTEYRQAAGAVKKLLELED